MATVQCSKCTVERKWFRRELDSWRHKLIHCVGFESILKGIYGPMLLRDLSVFDDCEPEEVDDWSAEASSSQCSFCNLPLDKLSDQVTAATSPLSSPSDCSPCQAPSISESSQSAHRFLQAVFNKKDVPLGCESNIPLVAQELMKKMVHQFAMDYASKCILHTSTNGFTSRTSSPLSETVDVPLDLTVTRTQEEKECEPEIDGVLDLSNRNSTCSAPSSTNKKSIGSLPPSLKEELGDLGQQWNKSRQSSLVAVLGTLCPVHRSLLYQILKQACQKKLLSLFSYEHADQRESYCCNCGGNPHDNVIPHAVTHSECKAHNSNPYYHLLECDHLSHNSTMYNSGDSRSNCSTHLYPVKGSKNGGSLGSNYCCLQRCRMETYTVVCPKRLHRISCQSLTVARINNMCSCTSSLTLSKSASLCSPPSSLCPSSSICCNQHKPHSCHCYSNHACAVQGRNTMEREIVDGDPPCPVLKRERSPSPPPLSPIPSDIDKKIDEKPPSLLPHRHEEETDVNVQSDLDTSHQKAYMNTKVEEELQSSTSRSCQAKQNPSGTLLQDVVDRFSEKLETIKPLEKDPLLVSTAVNVSEKEQLQSPLIGHNPQFQAEAHLTEIITKVLHKDSGSDYNLSELFIRHDNKELKSPNTRSRRRQEVLAAMATPADDSSVRRHTLQIKREFAMLDQACNRKKVSPQKKAKLNDGKVTVITSCPSSDLNLVIESKKEMEKGVALTENHQIGKGSLDTLSAKSYSSEVKDELQAVKVAKDTVILKAENEKEISREEKGLSLSVMHIPISELQSKYGNQDSNSDYEQNIAQMKTVTATAVNQCIRPCNEHGEVSTAGCGNNHEEAQSGQSCVNENGPGKGKNCHCPIRERQKCQSHNSKEARRSRRNIVPPQRFSSYVTEPRKMFFVACFSESIFNQSKQKDVLTSGTSDGLSKGPDVKDTQPDSRNEPFVSSVEDTAKLPFESTQKEQCRPSYTESETMAAKEQSPSKYSSEMGKDGSDNAAMPFRTLRSSPKRLQVSMTASTMPQNSSNGNIITNSTPCDEEPTNFLDQYTSPIKLMFVSAVKDKEGVKYSLKSANSCSSQVEEPFDPCEVSSWSGSPEKHKSQSSTKSPTSKIKSISLPLKSSTSHARSVRSPTKSASSPVKSTSSTPKSASPLSKSVSSSARFSPSPHKSASSPSKSASSSSKSASSPKSVSSSPKVGSRRSAEGTPTKRQAGTDSQRSPSDLLSFHEATPQKRRPGRPKKLGPQLEQKVKRPIGRPRKQKAVESVTGTETISGKSVLASDAEENVNKNLRITVVYGRSRRNKRMVSEGFDQLQTEFKNAWKAVGLKGDLGILMRRSKASSSAEVTSNVLSEDFKFVSPVKESAPVSSSNIKCRKQDDSVPSRKPGRPAKVKISGISVTVTTVSPRQRKIQINRDTQPSPETLIPKQIFPPEFESLKEPTTGCYQSANRSSQTEKGIETKNERKHRLPNQAVAVRHSVRVRKPSIHFLHAVATSTSRSYSHSNALLRRSKQLLINKANNERRKEEQLHSVAMTKTDKRSLPGKDKRKNISQDLGRVAGVSLDSIFTQKETFRWWAASTEEKTMNQELARRIRLISDTWVSDTLESKEKDTVFNSKLGTKGNNSFDGGSKHSSVVRTLFDCPPNRPSSCSMQQLCSWFMQTTETQSLAIVKKASSRNPEPRHFPRSANNKSICHSPQAERLRKHIKKFAKTVPKSPQQHQLAQRRLGIRTEGPLESHPRQLFYPRFPTGWFNTGVQRWQSTAFRNYQATLLRARKTFLPRKEREKWQKSQRNKKIIKLAASCSNGHTVHGLLRTRKALCRSAKDELSDGVENSSGTSSVDQTQEPVDVPKEQNICSKAWSPETLKECRVFLRKINSPDNESTEEEWDSCTVTLDDGSPSTYLFAARERELVGVVKAVKTERISLNRRTASRELAGSAPSSVQEQDDMPVRRQKGKYKGPGVVSTEAPQPPPAKMLRQSRIRGLTGPRWCDFVLEN